MSSADSLEVVCRGHTLNLPLHRFGKGNGTGSFRMLIVAGVHGREHSGVQTAYALAERLSEVSDLHGTIEILPVANPESFAAETRENPADGRNLGECFTVPSADGEDPSQTGAIARAILSRMAGCSHLLDLHSAGEARYLPHALFFREQDAQSAAAAGLAFALLRRTTREGADTGMLCRSASQQGIPALALELGGGITTWIEDIDGGIRAVLSLLAHWHYISPEYASDPTPPERVYPGDHRFFIRAWEEGAFYPLGELGRKFRKDDRIGTWVSLQTLESIPVLTMETGTLIYLRSRCRTHRGDTLAMLLPEVSVEEGEQGRGAFSLWHK
jgi:predicted deacylase